MSTIIRGQSSTCFFLCQTTLILTAITFLLMTFSHITYCQIVPLTLEKTRLSIIESIPIDLQQPNSNESIFSAWKRLISSAKESIHIACFYMTLTDGKNYDPKAGGYQGQEIFDELVRASQERNVEIQIIQQESNNKTTYQEAMGEDNPSHDIEELSKLPNVLSRSLDLKRFSSGGILHTKFLIIDQLHTYIGSANFDWRALTQTKELGIVVDHSSTFAQDLYKIFQIYWLTAENQTLPNPIPASITTKFNALNPIELELSQVKDGHPLVFISSAPPIFAAPEREKDLAAVLNLFEYANDYVCFSVMDYAPLMLYQHPMDYWPSIDNAIRKSALRGAKIRLLFSKWKHTRPFYWNYYKSLDVLHNVQVRVIELPNSPVDPLIPFSRVSHSKYMFSEKAALVTTSNCSGDYYVNTAGISVNISKSQTIIDQLSIIFFRDWFGEYTHSLDRKPWYHASC